jgi:hypothetical protein
MTIEIERDDRESRAGRNQSLFREINERMKELNAGFSLASPTGDWVCECANDACSERIELTPQEYEALRCDGTCFAVAPAEAHVFTDAERVVERLERYWVVEKTGEAGAVAAELDPRS